MNKTFRYTFEGTGGDGQTWKTEGTVTCKFLNVFDVAGAASFDQLTSGRAVFGKPGVGCRGPYDIHKVTIEQVRQ